MSPDLALRRRVFWVVLAGTAVCVAAAHWLEARLSYDVGNAKYMRHGSFGAALGRYPTSAVSARTVCILGNSVYQNHRIVPVMERLAREERRPVRFINLALTGAGISDYVVQAALAARHRPDLLVICLAECTFLPLGPKFRSDIDQQAFEPTVLAAVPWSYYGRHFTLASAGSSIVASIFPLARLDPVLRNRLTHMDVFPTMLARHIHFPHLNLVADFRRRARQRGQPVVGGNWPELPPAPDYLRTLDELLAVLERGGVPTLFLWQENRPTRHSQEIRAPVLGRIAACPIATVADFSGQWSAENFKDMIHPVPRHRETYARRHYQAICGVLDRL